ncbi:PREDICTED: transposon [Prunus dulcis]|uniref:PREDICTED: transposon n=1 Tax=Prunus dulcis TaxID=3755 RepID=A0A5E4G2L6_PRUDU|nr:PREDICTED: transposon [Prunus dulcis]
MVSSKGVDPKKDPIHPKVRETNVGSTIMMKIEALYFQRLYVCLDACKKGFLAGCKPIIGVYGCHLKGIFQGQLLVAVGINANDNMYPIPYVVAKLETKGLDAAFDLLCLKQHIVGVAPNVAEFECEMNKMKGLESGEAAHDWLMNMDINKWVYPMRRLQVKNDSMRGHEQPICPTTQNKLDKFKSLSKKYVSMYFGNGLFQDLTSIPCHHVVAAIFRNREDAKTHPPPLAQTIMPTGPRGGTFITPASATTRMRPPIPPPTSAQSQNAYDSSGLRQTRNSPPWKLPGKEATKKQGMHIPKKQKT